MSRPLYIAPDDLHGKIPPAVLTEALDDDADGQIDPETWETVAAGVCDEIDGILGQRYTVPFAALPATPPVVKSAAVTLACEAVYLRRGKSTEEENPWRAPANAKRKKLDAIAAGDEPLTPTAQKPARSVVTITEPARTSSAHGHLST